MRAVTLILPTVLSAVLYGLAFTHLGSGPAVVVKKLNGGRVALSAGTRASADKLAGILNRAARRAHDDGQAQQPR